MKRVTCIIEDEETGKKKIAFRVPSGALICPDVELRPDYYFALNRLYETENKLESIEKLLAAAERTINVVQDQLDHGTFCDSYVEEALSEWEAFSRDQM